MGLFDDLIYKEYGVLTSQAIQEQYHKIITDSRRKYKLPLEHFWIIKEESSEIEPENTDDSSANSGKDVTKPHEFATTMPQTKEETDTDIKGKQERNMENEIKPEIKKDIETEREGKDGKENERSMPPVPSNSVFQASPVVVEGLSLDKSIGKETVSEGMQAGGGSEAILLLNMQTIGIRNEQTVKAIVALAPNVKNWEAPAVFYGKFLVPNTALPYSKRMNRVITFFGHSIIRRNLKTPTTGH